MIILTITCDNESCGKELEGKKGYHVDVIESSTKTNYNFCSTSCMVDYFYDPDDNAIDDLKKGIKCLKKGT